MTRLLGALLFILTTHTLTSAHSYLGYKEVGEYIAAFSIKDDTLFYATKSGNVFKSVDTGISYSPYCSVPADFNVSALLLLGNTILYGTNNSGIYASTDSGRTWSPRYTGIPDSCITSLAAMRGIIYAGTNTAGIFMSADTGATWKAVNNGLTSTSIQSIAIQNNRILASTRDSMLFISADSGENWDLFSLTFLDNSLTIHQIACSDSLVYVDNYYHLSICTLSVSTNSLKIPNSIFGTPEYTPYNNNSWYFSYHPRISAIATCNGRIFFGTDCGIIYGANIQDTVARDSLGEPLYSVYSSFLYSGSFFSLTFNNKRLYAGTREGIIMSMDSGAHWTKISDSTVANRIQSIAIYDSIIIASSNSIEHMNYTENEKSILYRSTNRGKTWSVLDSSFSTSQPRSVAFCGRFLFLAREDHLLLSPDFGDTWVISDSGLGNAQITVLAVNNSFIYASGDSGIFQSSDTGKSWIKIKNASGISDLIVTDTHMFALHNEHLYRSDLNFDNWTLIPDKRSPGSEPDYYPGSCIVSIGNVIFIGSTNYGLYQIDSVVIFRPPSFSSVDSGISWGESPGAITFDFVVCDSMLFAATQNGVYRENGKQENLELSSSPIWESINKGLPSDIRSLASLKTVIYAASRSQGVFFWNSSDSMWNPNNNGLTNLSIFKIITSGDNILAATPNGVFYSNTCCGPWTRSSGIPDSTAIVRLASCGRISVAISSTNNTYRSVNNGMSWEPMSKFTDNEIISLAMLDTVIFASCHNSFGGVLFRSTDNGQHWECFNPGFPGNPGFSATIDGLLAVDSVLLAATTSDIYISKNYGDSWITTISMGGYKYNNRMVVYNGYLYVSQAFTGIVRIDLQAFLPVKNPLIVKNTITTDIRVLNHTSNSVIFSLTIPHYEQVRLSVYDVRGRLIAAPVNTHLPAGKHRISWSASTNAKGFYILKMQAGKKQIVRKFQMF